MNRPTGGEPERHVDSSRAPASSHSDDPSSAAVRSPTGEVAADALPPDGTLVWVPPEGDPREVTHSELRFGREPDESGRSCPDCDATRSVETIVREHAECGHVTPQGFLAAAEDRRFACPKCESEPDDAAEDAFGVVATVHSCLRCGRVLDRPLGRVVSDR